MNTAAYRILLTQYESYLIRPFVVILNVVIKLLYKTFFMSFLLVVTVWLDFVSNKYKTSICHDISVAMLYWLCK